MNNQHSWARTVDTPNLSSPLTLNVLGPIASGLGSPVVAVRPGNVTAPLRAFTREWLGRSKNKARESAGVSEQWDSVVDRGRNLVNEQTSRVTAAVQAGKEAYRSGASETSGS